MKTLASMIIEFFYDEIQRTENEHAPGYIIIRKGRCICTLLKYKFTRGCDAGCAFVRIVQCCIARKGGQITRMRMALSIEIVKHAHLLFARASYALYNAIGQWNQGEDQQSDA